MRILSIFTLGLALGLAPAAQAQLTGFEVIDYPGATTTTVHGINDPGEIVGDYTAPDKTVHGFLLRGGRFTAIDFPGAAATNGRDINRSGDVVGGYTDSSGKTHGFLLSGGRFTSVDFPGAETSVIAINAKGEMVGMYWNLSGDSKHRGFLFSGGRFTSFEYPAPNLMSCFFEIGDEGDMVGHWQDTNGVRHGWLVRQGKSSSFDYPGAQQTMLERAGITAAGDIVGSYVDPRGKAKSFLWTRDGFTPFDIPGSRQTHAARINASGQIVGRYQDAGGVIHGFLTRVAPSSTNQLLTVDDDGAECPGAGFRTIQEAVAAAPPEATILVCPGIYRGTVNISGPGKIGLKLIATGGENAVILQGEYTDRDGFHLENVNNVLIRGFTVRDFGKKATTNTDWGEGNQIYLENADYNTIEHNRLINGDMMGIMVMDSAHNIVQHNLAAVDNPNLANCGIHVGGRKSTGNYFRQNLLFANKVAGIMLSGAGPGNFVLDNTVLSNGRDGITNGNTDGTWIEGNRVIYGTGPQGTSPYAKEVLGQGRGINVANSTGVTVFDNRMRGNSAVDLNWDGTGENKFDANACETSNRAGACSR